MRWWWRRGCAAVGGEGSGETARRTSDDAGREDFKQHLAPVGQEVGTLQEYEAVDDEHEQRAAKLILRPAAAQEQEPATSFFRQRMTGRLEAPERGPSPFRGGKEWRLCAEERPRHDTSHFCGVGRHARCATVTLSSPFCLQYSQLRHERLRIQSLGTALSSRPPPHLAYKCCPG